MDTLTVDTLALSQWRANPEYDYSAEFKGSDFSLLEWIDAYVQRFFDELFGGVSPSMSTTMWYLLGVACIIAIAAFVAWRHPELFARRNRTTSAAYDIENDNIYGVDFDAAIAAAIASHDCRQAVRLHYLHALRLLADAGLIEWQLSKTPTAYTREYDDDRFRRMSREFMRVRYGGFAADQQLVDSMAEAKRHIENSIRQATQPETRHDTQQKGGAQ